MVAPRKGSPSPASEISTYVALLRGVNVGGRGKMSMADLRTFFVAMGFEEVRTVIQSGNVVFRCHEAPSASRLEAAIVEQLGVASMVVLRSAAALQHVVVDAPFDEVDRAHVHVGFMAQAPSIDEISSLDVERFDPEQMRASSSELYFFLPNGMGQSKLPAYVARKLTVPMTVRNWNTVVALASLSAP